MTAPIRLFDQDHTETPRTPPGAVDYPLPDQRQRGLSSDRFCLDLKSQAEIDAELPRYANLRTGGNMPSDAQWVTPVFVGLLILVVVAVVAGAVLT